MSLSGSTISQIQKSLSKKEFSVLDLCKTYLSRINVKDQKINAFLQVNEDDFLSQAKKCDEKINKGEKPELLFGVPFAVKDNILVNGLKCTAGSKILENYIAPYDATVIEKLKSNGAIMIGKTNLDEFAMGSSTENSAFGPTKNPHDIERVPGGSSGGSAAAVAADFCSFSLGSDTGGSIRQPASFCGVTGFNPSWGSVSRYGLIAFASSLDKIGPITKTVEDAQIVFNAIKGKDIMDNTSLNVKAMSGKLLLSNLRIGVPKEYFIDGMDLAIKENIQAAIKKCEEAGMKVQEVSLPHTEYALPCYYIIAPSEASSNLARYDGIKYGLSSKQNDLIGVYLKSREEGFGKEVKRRIMLGTYALSAGYYDAYYLLAQKIRALIKQDFDKAFDKVDIILSPTCPSVAFKLGEKTKDPLSMYLSDILTVAADLAGIPALSLHSGNLRGLPVGLQLIGRQFEDDLVLEVGKEIEKIIQ